MKLVIIQYIDKFVVPQKDVLTRLNNPTQIDLVMVAQRLSLGQMFWTSYNATKVAMKRWFWKLFELIKIT